jgi:predicted RNase H-like HicB family nuclease
MPKQNRHRYEIILYWSDEDQAYLADVPELAGCAGDGATYQEALDNVGLVITEWMENGQGVGPPDSRTARSPQVHIGACALPRSVACRILPSRPCALHRLSRRS